VPQGWTPQAKGSAGTENLKEGADPAAVRPGVEFITLGLLIIQSCVFQALNRRPVSFLLRPEGENTVVAVQSFDAAIESPARPARMPWDEHPGFFHNSVAGTVPGSLA
jgi:hypothetical protein